VSGESSNLFIFMQKIHKCNRLLVNNMLCLEVRARVRAEGIKPLRTNEYPSF
jgi:hypothetical protein